MHRVTSSLLNWIPPCFSCSIYIHRDINWCSVIRSCSSIHHKGYSAKEAFWNTNVSIYQFCFHGYPPEYRLSDWLFCTYHLQGAWQTWYSVCIPGYTYGNPYWDCCFPFGVLYSLERGHWLLGEFYTDAHCLNLDWSSWALAQHILFPFQNRNSIATPNANIFTDKSWPPGVAGKLSLGLYHRWMLLSEVIVTQRHSMVYFDWSLHRCHHWNSAVGHCVRCGWHLGGQQQLCDYSIPMGHWRQATVLVPLFGQSSLWHRQLVAGQWPSV